MVKKSLENWVEKNVRERWDRENNEYLQSQGFEKDILQHPEKIPAVQAGDYPGSAISYDKDFPVKAVSGILSAASNKEEAEAYINEVFSRIERKSEPVADGDHHSITYGENVFTA